jgi:TatD DNase family protein
LEIVDTHCHLNHPDFFGDLPEVLRRAGDAGVGLILCAGYDLESSVQAARLAREISMIRASVGIHPHDASTLTPETLRQIRDLAAENDCVVAIGETGLDYYRNLSPRKVQQESYRTHIRLAHELDLPLIVHSRDAQQDVLAILTEEGMPPHGVVMHCLPSDADFARGSVEMGCHVGIAGPVTFQNAEKLREIARELPLDRILLETDAPYLTPHPYRGKRNEPAYVRLVAEKVAEVRGIPADDLIAATTSNARRIFRLL